MDILTILTLTIHKHDIYFHLYVSFQFLSSVSYCIQSTGLSPSLLNLFFVICQLQFRFFCPFTGCCSSFSLSPHVEEVQDVGAGRPWIYLLPRIQCVHTYIYTYSISSWRELKADWVASTRQTAEWAHREGWEKWTHGNDEKVTCSRKGYHWGGLCVDSPALGHGRNQCVKCKVYYKWENPFTNPRTSVTWMGNFWNSLQSWSW